MKTEPKLVQMSSVEPKKVEWIWNPYIPSARQPSSTAIWQEQSGEGVRSISFTVDEDSKFYWKGCCDITPNELSTVPACR